MTLTIRPKFSIFLIIILLIALFSWIEIHQHNSKKSPLAMKKHKKSNLKTRLFQVEKKALFLELTGVTIPSHSLDIRTQVNGVVTDILTTKGETVAEKEVLIKLSRYENNERLVQAQALLKQHMLEYEAAVSLNKTGYKSKTVVAQAKTALEDARVALKHAQIALQNTVINAPFKGIIDDIPVSVGDFVTTGTKIAVIARSQEFKITVNVPENIVNQVHLNDTAEATLANGTKVKGIVSSIDKIPDSATRTYKVDITIQNDFAIRGMTAKVRIKIAEVMVQKISYSALNLNDQGIIGVKAIDDSKTVSFIPIHIVEYAKEYVLVDNLPRTIRIITFGQAFVQDKEKIS